MASQEDRTLSDESDSARSRYIRALVQSGPIEGPSSGRVRIPKTLIQYWHDAAAVPVDVRDCMETWQPLLASGFRHCMFSDVTAREFIKRVLGEPYLTAFDRCPHPAMRCDYFRLCYVWNCGGFYVDADDAYQGGDYASLYCDNRLKLQPLCYDTRTDTMVSTSVFTRRIYSPTWIFYVNNNPLVAPPVHPLLRAALRRATRLLLHDNAARLCVQSTTGPGNLTATLVQYCCTTRREGGMREVLLLSNWDSISQSRWPLSYRGDERNWRLWRPLH